MGESEADRLRMLEVLSNFDPPTAMKQTMQISKWLKSVK